MPLTSPEAEEASEHYSVLLGATRGQKKQTKTTKIKTRKKQIGDFAPENKAPVLPTESHDYV